MFALAPAMHPRVFSYSVLIAESLELYGVPGPVRTANLPLRRGMLYPIELLGQIAVAAPGAVRRTACMLTAKVGFVMSSVGFLSVGRCLPERLRPGPVNPALDVIVQNALPQNAIIANCNQTAPQIAHKPLILLI